MSSAAIPLTSRQLVWGVEKLRFPIPVPPRHHTLVAKASSGLSATAIGICRTRLGQLQRPAGRLCCFRSSCAGNPQADVLDCLRWLRGNCSPTPLQLDYWLCQQAVSLLAQRKETCGPQVQPVRPSMPAIDVACRRCGVGAAGSRGTADSRESGPSLGVTRHTSAY